MPLGAALCVASLQHRGKQCIVQGEDIGGLTISGLRRHGRTDLLLKLVLVQWLCWPTGPTCKDGCVIIVVRGATVLPSAEAICTKSAGVAPCNIVPYR